MKLQHRYVHRAGGTPAAAELGVERVYHVDDPLWYLRLSARFRLSWRRELATVATAFSLGIALGLLFGHVSLVGSIVSTVKRRVLASPTFLDSH